MHTIWSAQDQPILVSAGLGHQRAVRPRLRRTGRSPLCARPRRTKPRYGIQGGRHHPAETADARSDASRAA